MCLCWWAWNIHLLTVGNNTAKANHSWLIWSNSMGIKIGGGEYLWLQINPSWSHTGPVAMVTCTEGVWQLQSNKKNKKNKKVAHTHRTLKHWPARLGGSVGWAAGRRGGCWAAASPGNRQEFGCQQGETSACWGPKTHTHIKRCWKCLEFILAFHIPVGVDLGFLCARRFAPT